MRAHGIGLTKLYNRFHDQANSGSEITELRESFCEIDQTVAGVYGWDDIDLGHRFHEVAYLPKNNCMRFTISEAARVEILRRLAELNRERYEEETNQQTNVRRNASTKATNSENPADDPFSCQSEEYKSEKIVAIERAYSK